jgi:hypothetical protein
MSLADDLGSAVKSVCKKWKQAKRHTDKNDRVSSYSLSRMRYSPPRVTIRDAAFDVMEAAYQKASGNGQYPANARQIYYAARPRILEMTGEDSLDSQYFTQTLLKDYLDDCLPSWDVVWDARGHIIEPHTKKMVGLGGLEVRDYVDEFTNGDFNETPYLGAEVRIPTTGPILRYGAVLFIEKEGFNPLLDAAKISERHDIAITSSKGMPVSALCDLLARLRDENIKAYVVHDFDKAGFSILSKLQTGTRGSMGSGEIVDLGFRLADIGGLDRERVNYGRSDPTWNLSENGATQEEINILVQGRWWGERVELNAMTSDQFIEWLERKLTEHGIKKLIPDSDTLAAAYRRAVFLQKLEEEEESLREKISSQQFRVPKNLLKRVNKILKDQSEAAWDEAVWQVAARKD